MSLIKQLWLAIVVVTLAAFGISFVVSTLSARDYIQQELQRKNIDNANALALAMTQLPKDPTTLELLLAAQFDNSHYEYIRLTDPTGKHTMMERSIDTAAIVSAAPGSADALAPGWFRQLVPIRSAPAHSLVSDGWTPFATLSLKSDPAFAYGSLWHGTVQLVGWFVAGAVLIGLLGTVLLRTLLRPLDKVVAQAQAIGERRFVSIEAPATPEFAAVVSAMNTLSTRVRTMLEEESARLESLRQAAQHDPVSGLLNREHFLAQVAEVLESDNAPRHGALVIVRLSHLIAVNESLGRAAADALLRTLADNLGALLPEDGTWLLGRLNGTDFALLAPELDTPAPLAAALAERLELAVGNHLPEAYRALPIGIACYQRGDTLPQLLAHADVALDRSEAQADTPPQVEHVNPATRPATDLAGWRSLIEQALDSGRFHLAQFPVVDRHRQILHLETPVRMQHPTDGIELTAGDVLPWATRCGLLPRIDETVVDQALALIASTRTAVCINLSTESMCHAPTIHHIAEQLAAQPAAARQLSIDLPEAAAFRHAVEFRALCRRLKPLGCRIGLEHVSAQVCRIGELHDVGLDYLKISAAVIRGIDTNPGNQTFLRGLATIAHTMGMQVIAEGVASLTEAEQLDALGFDGLTGPGIRH
ncbi:bifunctional diguanylate cyclase/phosphodiesterase [Denitromonas iodatirespirans]|uniref:EAL domain-containing protein n=1 Tax=Denitromonas iodatirespirans TaxID=2795389 RepID=A0A944DEM4_DENI1|nr:EAL domain-containing protein [Denitromonas iodatirespirans]MBT0962912.1 EAL domain-containing protein [Denitromonas iodatirespirans]